MLRIETPCQVVLTSHLWKSTRDRLDDITRQPMLEPDHIGYAKPYHGNKCRPNFKDILAYPGDTGARRATQGKT